MKYYITLQDTLIFFCNESKNGFKTIKKIVDAINSSPEEKMRDVIIDFLIQNEIILGYHDESTGKFHVENTNTKNI